jgi:hypothetical protein
MKRSSPEPTSAIELATTVLNHVINIGGPEKISFARLVREVLALRHDDQRVVVDRQATYFGTTLKKDSPVTGAGAMIASIPF